MGPFSGWPTTRPEVVGRFPQGRLGTPWQIAGGKGCCTETGSTGLIKLSPFGLLAGSVSGLTVDLSGLLRARVVSEELAAGGTHLVVAARRRQRLTKLRRKLRSAHGVEIEVLAADLGESRAPQEIFALIEERGAQSRWTSRVISPAVVSNLTVNAAGRLCVQILQD